MIYLIKINLMALLKSTDLQFSVKQQNRYVKRGHIRVQRTRCGEVALTTPQIFHQQCRQALLWREYYDRSDELNMKCFSRLLVTNLHLPYRQWKRKVVRENHLPADDRTQLMMERQITGIIDEVPKRFYITKSCEINLKIKIQIVKETKQ